MNFGIFLAADRILSQFSFNKIEWTLNNNGYNRNEQVQKNVEKFVEDWQKFGAKEFLFSSQFTYCIESFVIVSTIATFWIFHGNSVHRHKIETKMECFIYKCFILIYWQQLFFSLLFLRKEIAEESD